MSELQKEPQSKPETEEFSFASNPDTRRLSSRREGTVKCFYCFEQLTAKNKHRGRPNFRTKDHLWPQKHGGQVVVDCCLRCNCLKSDMDPVLFFRATYNRWHLCPKYPFKEPERKVFFGELYSYPGWAKVVSRPFHDEWKPSEHSADWYYKELMKKAQEI